MGKVHSPEQGRKRIQAWLRYCYWPVADAFIDQEIKTIYANVGKLILMKVTWVFWFPEHPNLDLAIYNIAFVHKRLLMNSLKIENMGNKYNYENVLGEIACYIAKNVTLLQAKL